MQMRGNGSIASRIFPTYRRGSSGATDQTQGEEGNNAGEKKTKHTFASILAPRRVEAFTRPRVGRIGGEAGRLFTSFAGGRRLVAAELILKPPQTNNPNPCQDELLEHVEGGIRRENRTKAREKTDVKTEYESDRQRRQRT